MLLNELSLVNSISCKNEIDTDVNSWTILKMPQGTNYYYYDNTEFIYSDYSLNDTQNGALTHTMNQLWTLNPNYLIYNDETPHQTEYNFSVAHSKGVIIWDSNSAVIITHSIPKFPQGPSQQQEYTGLMENAWDYGQDASCMPLSLSALEAVYTALVETTPLVYDQRGEISTNKYMSQQKQNVPCTVTPIDSSYIYFTKSSSDQVDIWGSCVTPYFGMTMKVESWIHGEMEGVYCPPKHSYQTLDIKSLQFLNGTEFVEYSDHSKWGIGDNPLVCFGDMNRVTSQLTRSGGVYCWKDSDLWNNLNNAIQETSNC